MIQIRAALIFAATTALIGCVGPRPKVTKWSLIAPRSPGDPYVVIATIQNAGRGEGQVEAIARLRSKRTKQTVAESRQQVDLARYEMVQVTFELKAPADEQYEVAVLARYPP